MFAPFMPWIMSIPFFQRYRMRGYPLSPKPFVVFGGLWLLSHLSSLSNFIKNSIWYLRIISSIIKSYPSSDIHIGHLGIDFYLISVAKTLWCVWYICNNIQIHTGIRYSACGNSYNLLYLKGCIFQLVSYCIMMEY